MQLISVNHWDSSSRANSEDRINRQNAVSDRCLQRPDEGETDTDRQTGGWTDKYVFQILNLLILSSNEKRNTRDEFIFNTKYNF